MSKLFLHGSTTCPYCNGNINIVEGLVYDYSLDSSGMPNNLHTESYKVIGYCKACSTPLIIIPNNEGGYTAYPEMAGIDLLISDVLRNKRSSIFGNKLLEADNNPFINATESILEDDDCPF